MPVDTKKGRPYRSKKQRPCDLCRRRKTCCVIHDKPPCMLCAKHGVKCTFAQKPSRRSVKRSAHEIKFYVPKNQMPNKKFRYRQNSDTKTKIAEETTNNQASSIPSLEDGVVPIDDQSYGFDLPFTIDMWNLMFKDLQNESIDPDLNSQKWKAESIAISPTESNNESSSSSSDGVQQLPSFHLQSQGINRFQVCSVAQIEDYIHGAVDADETIKIQYLSENSYMDPYVYQKVAKDEVRLTDQERSPNSVPTSRIAGQPYDGEMSIRRLTDHFSKAPPLIYVRSDPGLSRNDIATKEKINHLINNYGPRLLLLYFRFINPFLPLFSRGLFYFGTNQNMLEFHNSLLATLLTLAMDWWSADPFLQQHTMPSDMALFKIARQAIMEDQDMPNYSSLQACILLSQKRPSDPSKPDTPFTWMILGMASSLVDAMGYNHDCSSWNIPDWDKKLRKRIWWTFVIQDTWFAACYGKSLHISTRKWHVPPLTKDDFESYNMSERDAMNFQSSVTSFCFLSKLSSLVAEICDNLLTDENPVPASFETLFTVGTFYLEKISSLGCPGSLQVNSSTLSWANGSIQLSLQVARILILRHLLHRIPSTGYENYYDKIIHWSMDCLRTSYHLVSELKVIQFHYFWYSWSRIQFAVLANFFLLVHNMATKKDEKIAIHDLMDDYRWWLRCNQSSFTDLSLAMNLLDRAYMIGISNLPK